jgi:hypothetical protein
MTEPSSRRMARPVSLTAARVSTPAVLQSGAHLVLASAVVRIYSHADEREVPSPVLPVPRTLEQGPRE